MQNIRKYNLLYFVVLHCVYPTILAASRFSVRMNEQKCQTTEVNFAHIFMVPIAGEAFQYFKSNLWHWINFPALGVRCVCVCACRSVPECVCSAVSDDFSYFPALFFCAPSGLLWCLASIPPTWTEESNPSHQSHLSVFVVFFLSSLCRPTSYVVPPANAKLKIDEYPWLNLIGAKHSVRLLISAKCMMCKGPVWV